MREEYVPIYVPWVNKRVGIEGTLQRPPYTLEMGREWVRGLDKSKGKDEVFAVLLNTRDSEQHRYIGHMGIHQIVGVDGFAKTGSILSPDYQGRGYGTEAKLLVLYHAFRILGLRKAISTVKAWNAQSLGHLLHCGYQVVGRYRAHHLHDGMYGDEILLEVFREDWEPVWEKYQKTKRLPKLTDAQRALVKKTTCT